MEESKQVEESRSEKGFFELLPRHIFEFFCDNYLSITDQLRFAWVCKSFNSLVYKRINPKSHDKDTPLLIGLIDNPSFCETIYNGQVTCYQIGTTSFKHPDPIILGYFKGWLCVLYFHNHNLIQLVNLFINIQVDLPPLPTLRQYHGSFRLCAQAFALSLCKSMRPIVIAIVDQDGNLALCKINNGGSSWTSYRHKNEWGHPEQYDNITFHHEKLYAMREYSDKIDMFKVDSDDLKPVPLGIIEYSQVFDVSLSPFLRQAYVVEDSKGDNMFVVMQYYEKSGISYIFEILKVEHGDRDVGCVKVDTLGDQILLLGDSRCSEIIDVKDCPRSPIFKGNQVCFKGRYSNFVGIYSLKDKTTIWVLPNRGMHQWLQWIFPRFATAESCNCESHS